MDYPTSDLGFAAVLHSLKYTINPPDISDPEHIIFSFKIPAEHIGKITLLHERYKVADAAIDARTYYRALKDLRFLIKTANATNGKTK